MSRQVAKRDEGLFTVGKPDWCKQRTEPLEVMCLGLCRTGTTTMLEAMEILGYGTMYNSRESFRRHQFPVFREALIAKHEGRTVNIEQFESLWGDYRTISGDTVVGFAEECIKLYPDAKVILTMRDNEEQWLESVLKTMWHGSQNWTTRFLHCVDPVYIEMAKFTVPYWKYIFWDDAPNHGIRIYREHNAMVKRLAAGRLLEYNTRDGWEPLCQFLGKEIPSVPFPHVNKTVEHNNLFRIARREALLGLVKRWTMNAALPSLVLSLIWWRRSSIGAILKKLKF